MNFSFILLGLCLSCAVYSQQSASAAGGDATGSGGSASYSVGQIVYTTITGANGSSDQGVQQTYEISEVTGIEEAKDITLGLLIYPNPASDFIILKIKNYKIENLRMRLYNINGLLLQDIKVEGSETVMQINKLNPSIYILKITDNERDIKTFKIIKN